MKKVFSLVILGSLIALVSCSSATKVKKLSLSNGNGESVSIGTALSLNLEVTPKTAVKDVEYEFDSESIRIIDDNYIPIKSGEITIKAKSISNPSINSELILDVLPNTGLSEIIEPGQSYSILIGESLGITLLFSEPRSTDILDPSSIPSPTLYTGEAKWFSSNDNVIVPDSSKSTVKGNKLGESEIWVSAEIDGVTYYAFHIITVVDYIGTTC